METITSKLDECSWTVPVALVWTPTTLLLLLSFVVYGLLSARMPCEVEGRITWLFIASAATAGACVAMAFRGNTIVRVGAGFLAALASGAVTWWIVSTVFGRHC